MTRDDWLAVLLGAVIGLLACSVCDAVAIARLRADVDFLTAVSEQNLDRSKRNG